MARIIVHDRTTVAVVYKGSVYALNLVNEEHRYEIKENTIGVINTFVPIDDNAYYINKAAITTRNISDEDSKKLDVSYQSLTNAIDSVIFVTINGEVIGIRIK
jgi:hypothetical protein